MIVKSAGFVHPDMIRSKNALNFAYVVYLHLRAEKANDAEIASAVKKWLVMSLLTSRYSGSPESTFDFDIRQITERGFWPYLIDLEAAQLSDGFWEAGLLQQLNSSSSTNPAFNVYLAAQCRQNAKGFLSKDITIRDMITHQGDVHHLFPADYLKKHNLNKGTYNQVANFVYTETATNIRIGNKAPNIYFAELREQCNGNQLKYGAITSINDLLENLRQNDVPEVIFDMSVDNYYEFLELRRSSIAHKLRKYYSSL